MTRVRRNGHNSEFLTLLERCKKGDGEKGRVEHLLTVSCENPEIFHEEWLRPLLAEGLDLDQALELVVEGALRPS